MQIKNVESHCHKDKMVSKDNKKGFKIFLGHQNIVSSRQQKFIIII